MDAKSYYEHKLKKYNADSEDLRSPDEFSIDCMIEFSKEVNGRFMPVPKVGQKLTAIDVFHLIISSRGWYKPYMSKQNAFHFKRKFINGEMGVERMERLFAKFGFRRVDVIWEKR